MRATFLGIAAAVFVHLAVLLFGGVLFQRPEQQKATARVENVDLLTAETEDRPKKEEEPPEEARDEKSEESDEVMEVNPEPPPDLSAIDVLQEPAVAAAAPALDALSLSALEGALNPGFGGGDDFGGAASLASGGRIGGTGTAAGMAAEEGPGGIFALPDLDQRPRPIFQAAPIYPFELRQKKVEGTVYVLFVVDQEGRVVNPSVEKSSHRAFEKPALDAVRQWKFEPAVRNGERVQARLRVPIRFERG